MSKIKIEIDLGDAANFINTEDIADMVQSRIRENIKDYYDNDITSYVKNYLDNQMERFADKFIEDHPDLQTIMENTIREMIVKESSYTYYVFSAPQSYDRDKERPGYTLIKQICADPDVKQKVKESLIEYTTKHFEKTDTNEFCRNIGYAVSDLLENSFIKEPIKK